MKYEKRTPPTKRNVAARTQRETTFWSFSSKAGRQERPQLVDDDRQRDAHGRVEADHERRHERLRDAERRHVRDLRVPEGTLERVHDLAAEAV